MKKIRILCDLNRYDTRTGNQKRQQKRKIKDTDQKQPPTQCNAMCNPSVPLYTFRTIFPAPPSHLQSPLHPKRSHYASNLRINTHSVSILFYTCHSSINQSSSVHGSTVLSSSPLNTSSPTYYILCPARKRKLYIL